MIKPRHLYCFLFALLLSACGFQLQTRAELPAEMQHTRLEVQAPFSKFASRLETHLEQNGVRVVKDADDAAVLEVPQNSVRREIQSIGDNARVREYMLRHTVQFRLLDSDGKEMIPLQTLEQTRVYSFDQQDILSKEREDEFLREDLSDALARMVVRRLGTYGK
ncbi:MAG: LPS assembly lipoprotein LptE [Xanthomonadales bacterium]|nr:LPS assembly lipoprotein LptE [Xanthomonadales bacterium]